ncbi:alpha/beta hydrolase [Polaromonas sp. JS666]|uniref:alpha/beta hydrolase n=1 Tax=Polaromonas sp. (strain JS666 / ATCC BAA-500) TaxID=296591 RepID=UPI0000464DF7|nr:alpha/beta fold hydrolase [Polaromonas sp. JS666]ABE42214.1 putative transmembrane protein [Polaromonas sp. JS666]
MNSHTRKSSIEGPAGALEIALDAPAGISRGMAIIAHPHPLFGGTMDNKVVQTLARAFLHCGWTAVRFNFRGVGGSAGSHDEGRGELDDLLAVVQHVSPVAEGDAGASAGALALAGFSFGAFVTTHAFARLNPVRPVEKLVLVGTSVSRAPAAPIDAAAHLKTLVVHGEQDDTVLLPAVLDWARPQALPVTVVPGGGHFFHGQLPLLKNLVIRHLSSPPI